LTPSKGRLVAQSASSPTLRSVGRRSSQIRKPSFRDSKRRNQVVANAPADKASIFQKLFGKPAPSIFGKLFGKPSPPTLTVAYAAPDGGGLGDGQGITSGGYDRQTAVYDISTHTVYMPDGTILEAHSGLGARLDDPRHTYEKNRGATPPGIYDLELRERPFHGVRALRLIPVHEEKVFGRTGLLAHSYMLGPAGDSNGCVSFKNYDAFLQAYTNHEIKRLAVVARLD
jgi:Tlde1 domain